MKSALQALNTHLLPRTYLVGETITLADIGVACTLLQLYQYVLDTSFRLVRFLCAEFSSFTEALTIFSTLP